MSDFQLNTPVAFIIFNRPDTTERVFAEIAKAKPPKLLVVGDGPRTSRVGEADRVAETRAIIEQVDWDCEVLTNYSDINLGCKRRVSSGIDWVFEQVDEAIILEDDCLPDSTFFRFCEELLARYRSDQRISQINGCNLQFGYCINDDSFYFSNYPLIWGWATWRDRWKNSYDVEMKSWPQIRNEGRLEDWVYSHAEQDFWKNIFEQVYQGKVDTWDYQWTFACKLNGRLSVLPNVNLISNIGFGADATHTTGSSVLANMPIEEMQFPLVYPEGIYASRILDRRVVEKFFSNSLYRTLMNKFIPLIRGLYRKE
jgi:hypothetical protein